MVDIFTCLADGTRRELLQRLLERSRSGDEAEVSVGELVASLGISQPTVSKHLKVLREHGLVTVREEGQHRYYRLDPQPFVELEAWLAPFLAAGPRTVEITDEDAGATVYAAWAGAEVGDRMGRAAAETAHSARVALEAAQEKLQGAQKSLGSRLPRLRRREGRREGRED